MRKVLKSAGRIGTGGINPLYRAIKHREDAAPTGIINLK